MAPPLSCADLTSIVLAEPCPLIFLDTAAILDVLRVPFRHELQVDIVDSAVAIVDEALTDPRRVWLVTTANVIQELDGRRKYVKDELEARLGEVNRATARISSIARVILPERRIAFLDISELKLEERIERIMDQVVNSMLVFRGSETCVGKARNRLWAGLPPASKAKQEFKDCEIFEEFLELVSAIRSQGFQPPAIFVTPNKDDYGPPPDGQPQVSTDLSALGASYVANISWARSLIRPPTK